MAFTINCTLNDYEYRGVRTGYSQRSNKQWMSLILESPDDARQLDVSVPDDLQSDIYNMSLVKGDKLAVPVMAVATNDYNYLRLSGLPFVNGTDY